MAEKEKHFNLPVKKDIDPGAEGLFRIIDASDKMVAARLWESDADFIVAAINTQQPATGEVRKFTEMVKLNISNWIPSIFNETGDVRVQSVVDWLIEACTRLNSQQAQIKKLKRESNTVTPMCTYCGKRWPKHEGGLKDIPKDIQESVQKHIESCKHHPLSKAKAEIKQCTARLTALKAEKEELKTICGECGSTELEIIVVPSSGYHSKEANGILIPVWKCKDCGFQFLDWLMEEIATGLIEQALDAEDDYFVDEIEAHNSENMSHKDDRGSSEALKTEGKE